MFSPRAIELALAGLAKECYNIAADHGFHDAPNPFAQSIALIHSEASEALEAYRDDCLLDWVKKEGMPNKPVGMLSELADIIIRVLDTAEELSPGSLGAVLLAKMEYNRARPVGHGRVRL